MEEIRKKDLEHGDYVIFNNASVGIYVEVDDNTKIIVDLEDGDVFSIDDFDNNLKCTKYTRYNLNKFYGIMGRENLSLEEIIKKHMNGEY
jgi:hypothetical protein